MNRSKLSSHEFKKGVFTTPFNSIGNIRINKWNYDRMPAYIWLGLVIQKYGHTNGLEKCFKIIKYIVDLKIGITFPTMNSLFALSESNQEIIYKFALNHISSDVLYPLTLIYPYTKKPTFNKYFNVSKKDDDRKEKLVSIIEETYDHQSNISSDIRFIVVWSAVLNEKIKFAQDMLIIEALKNYAYHSHSDEIMRQYRPTIRSTEGVFGGAIENIFSNDFSDYFWKEISEMTDCKLLFFNIADETDNNEIDGFMKYLKSIAVYYEEFLRIFNPISIKAEVILTIFVYSYKRLLELVEHDLFNEISGRTIIRSIIENYIMIKYLVLEEPNHDDIWSDYISYGLGQYKLIMSKYSDNDDSPKGTHIPVDYIEAILESETDQKFLDMDTRYFDKKSIREKAKLVDEKDLFDYYYDYDSQFEHGIWGALRESVSIICDNPAHKYHHSLDVDNLQKHKSVWKDCKHIMQQTIDFLNGIYPLPPKVNKNE
ncbi:MAG: DUF5677 domain-containing protein [Candidatus Izemoplasmatales bacterium]|jgi:hypothetical protein